MKSSWIITFLKADPAPAGSSVVADDTIPTSEVASMGAIGGATAKRPRGAHSPGPWRDSLTCASADARWLCACDRARCGGARPRRASWPRHARPPRGGVPPPGGGERRPRDGLRPGDGARLRGAWSGTFSPWPLSLVDRADSLLLNV